MNIVIFARGYPTKEYHLNGIFEFDQAKALAGMGHHVIMAVLDLRSFRRKRKWGIFAFEKDGVDICCLNFPLGAVPNGMLYSIGGALSKRLFGFIIKHYGKIDLIHAHFMDMGIIASDYCSRKQIPFVITEHSSRWNDGSMTEKDLNRVKQAFQKADQIICVSHALQQIVEDKTGVKAIVIPNIVDMPQCSSGTYEKNLDHFHFVSAGSLKKLKGFDLLLEAFSRIPEGNKPFDLMIMGDGPEMNALQTQAYHLGINDRICFFGSYTRQQFAEVLNQSHCFVLPSRHETFGVVYAEAMQCGLPVIATKCGGPEDFINENVGMLVPIENIEELSKSMESIMKSKLYNKKKIQEYAQNKFSNQTIASQISKVYSDIIQEKKDNDKNAE